MTQKEVIKQFFTERGVGHEFYSIGLKSYYEVKNNMTRFPYPDSIARAARRLRAKGIIDYEPIDNRGLYVITKVPE